MTKRIETDIVLYSLITESVFLRTHHSPFSVFRITVKHMFPVPQPPLDFFQALNLKSLRYTSFSQNDYSELFPKQDLS